MCHQCVYHNLVVVLCVLIFGNPYCLDLLLLAEYLCILDRNGQLLYNGQEASEISQ